MRHLFLYILLFFVAGCNTNSKVDNLQVILNASAVNQIQLVDDLGQVTLSLPTRYDTSFSWTNYSDCSSCGKIEYRIQPKGLKITKESGFIWLGEPKDSIERFTVLHSREISYHDNNDILDIVNYHNNMKRNIILDPDTYKIKLDTIERIGSKYFSIITIDLYNAFTFEYSKKVLSATSIKSNIIKFNFELLSRQKDSITTNFIDNSINYLRTVRLSNNR